jgi:GT2 family glycosyltransferase
MLDISVIFATCKRIDTLQPMLERMCALDCSGIEWEILVVDNANDPATRALVDGYKNHLPLMYFVEAMPGKNFALNSVIEKAMGELVLFTDDDILPEHDWLQEVKAGAARWPQHNVFGGRILPHWPGSKVNVPDDKHFYVQCAYVIADWDMEEGLYPDVGENGLVWGPNMVVRRCVFEMGYRFNTSVGPKGKDYVMGSETEFTRRLFKSGMKAVYLPGSLVYHQIRASQLERKWLYERTYRLGRGEAYKNRHRSAVFWFGVPRHLYRAIGRVWIKKHLNRFKPGEYRRFALEYAILRGQIDQYRSQNRLGARQSGYKDY